MKIIFLIVLSVHILFAVDKEDVQIFTNTTINIGFKTIKSELVYFGTRENYLKNYKKVLESNIEKYSKTIAISSGTYVASTGLRAGSASSMDIQGGLIGLVAGVAAAALVDYIDALYRDEEYMFVSYIVNEKGEQGLLLTLLVSADDLKTDEAKKLVEDAQKLYIKEAV